jgi:AraC family transcriptional regulator
MNNVIDHVEENIAEPLTLKSISDQFNLSAFHFSRLFKMLTGTSIKQYILGRKLAFAAEMLKTTTSTVTDIAYDIGFEYPEVFSRDFKKCFGLSPSTYRKNDCDIPLTLKVSIVERNIMNYKGIPALKETYEHFNAHDLYGINIEADEKDSGFSSVLASTGERFFTGKSCLDFLKNEYLYTVVNCLGDESGRYSVFYGGEPIKDMENSGLNQRNVPAGWYARFSYHGDMLEMLSTFNDDFYRWMLVKEIEPSPNGIGMFNIYERQNPQNVSIYVPVKEPK